MPFKKVRTELLLLLGFLPSAAFCRCCLLLGVDAPAHIVGPHTWHAKHTSEAKAHRTRIFLFISRAAAALVLHDT